MQRLRFARQSNRADWSHSLTVRDMGTGAPIDLTGAAVTLTIKSRDGDLTFTTASGEIVLGAQVGVLTWTIPASRMREFSPGNHDVGCLIERSGAADTLFTGILPITDGYTP